VLDPPEEEHVHVAGLPRIGPVVGLIAEAVYPDAH